jgi:hypothetical protein
MFGLRPKLPVSEEERLWVDEGFRRLSRMLGSNRMRNTRVILPTDEFFPDAFDSSEEGLRSLFRRVCGYMQVDPSLVDLEIIPDSSELMEMLPEVRHSSNDPAGLHFGAGHEEDRPLIAVRQNLLKDPLVLVATIAHELGHVILLGGGHLRRDEEDMEPLTDLVTVYLGLGLFTANSSRRFRQYQNDRRAGWSMQRLGYLPEVVYGYALARFAFDRGEDQAPWTVHLSTNLKAYFQQSMAWLRKNAVSVQ